MHKFVNVLKTVHTERMNFAPEQEGAWCAERKEKNGGGELMELAGPHYPGLSVLGAPTFQESPP